MRYLFASLIKIIFTKNRLKIEGYAVKKNEKKTLINWRYVEPLRKIVTLFFLILCKEFFNFGKTKLMPLHFLKKNKKFRNQIINTLFLTLQKSNCKHKFKGQDISLIL